MKINTFEDAIKNVYQLIYVFDLKFPDKCENFWSFYEM